MKSVVRTFLFNPEGQILLAQHKKDTPWVLPGGHVESGESLHEAMIREIREEFGLEAQFFEMDSEEILHHRGKKLAHHPLPIAIYDLEYKNSEGKDKSRTEYVFLMELSDPPLKGGSRGVPASPNWWDHLTIQTSEIHDYKWFDVDDILSMKPNVETWDFMIEMLEKIVGEEEMGE